GGVNEGLALAQAGTAWREIQRVGTEAAGGQAKAGARPRGRLEEQVDDDLADQVSAFLPPPLTDGDELLGTIQNGLELWAAEVFQAQQVALGRHPSGRGPADRSGSHDGFSSGGLRRSGATYCRGRIAARHFTPAGPPWYHPTHEQAAPAEVLLRIPASRANHGPGGRHDGSPAAGAADPAQEGPLRRALGDPRRFRR